LRKWMDTVLPVLPWAGLLGWAKGVVAVVSASVQKMVGPGLLLLLAGTLHMGWVFLLGYLGALTSRYSILRTRTTAVEVGMQNSGLAATLAAAHFSPVAALPAAVFSVWHNISGGLLAVFFRYRSARATKRAAVETAAVE